MILIQLDILDENLLSLVNSNFPGINLNVGLGSYHRIFPREQFNLHSILIPLAVIKGIKNFLSIDLSIKWPNDIMYKNKKLAGILIESKISKLNDKKIFNIGLGINVNEHYLDFPHELQKKVYL